MEGGFNANLGNLDGAERGENIAADLVDFMAAGLEDMSSHFCLK